MPKSHYKLLFIIFHIAKLLKLCIQLGLQTMSLLLIRRVLFSGIPSQLWVIANILLLKLYIYKGFFFFSNIHGLLIQLLRSQNSQGTIKVMLGVWPVDYIINFFYYTNIERKNTISPIGPQGPHNSSIQRIKSCALPTTALCNYRQATSGLT